jgi:hypothetical protein
MKQNVLRWLAEFTLIIFGLMVLDDGLFAILITAVFGILESVLLILTHKYFIAWTFVDRKLRYSWVPIFLFAICFAVYCCYKR